MLFCSCLYLIFFFFPSKILTLLLLEFLFLSCLSLFFFLGFSSSSGLIFFISIFLVFLVLDSVIGVCVLVSIGRSSSSYSNFVF